MSDVEAESSIESTAIQALSADGLAVVIDMTVTYKIDTDKIIDIRKTIGTSFSYVEKIIKPNARTRIRESASQYGANNIFEGIKSDFAKNGIILESVLIRNINLPESVKAAIEAKINAEQEAQKMEFVLKKEEQEAERKRVEAKGIADYQRIISSTLTDKQLKYESIKALESISKSQNSKVVFVGSGKSDASILIGN
ncbi:hypothetical protein CHS0354_023850 [Potamilus streckersoni]|uniref:Prohibitin n=1 Tax=Potamilus streckersoni TaxID=2493646 RepID=A0AAE0RZ73_9BIVA|nr:hypothetical protein CHS0354_023850 [Potamilus streckersoni]